MIKEFEELKSEYQNEADNKEKKRLREEIEKSIIKIFEEKINQHIPQLRGIEKKYSALPNKEQREKTIIEAKQRLTKKLGFDIEQIEKDLTAYTEGRKAKDFFLWKVYFAEVFTRKGGFDVVIGNPPYGFRNVLTTQEKKYFRKIEKIEFRSGDSAELFCKKSFENLVINKGVLSFIIPKKCTYGDYWDGWRTNYFKKYDLKFVLDAGKAFDKVLLEQTAFGLVKQKQNGTVHLGFLDNKKDKLHHFSDSDKDSIFKTNNTLQMYLEFFPRTIFRKIQRKIDENTFVSGDLGLGIGTNFFSNKETNYKLLKGIDIERWKVKSHRYLKNKNKLNWKNAQKFLKPKVIAQVLVAHIENPTPHLKITACLDSKGIIITNTLTTFVLGNSINEKFWLAYLNSSLISWYTYNYIYGRAIRTMHLYSFYIEQIPILKISKSQQKPFETLADKIITKKESGESTTAEEQQIDLMVYKLYELTYDEVKIVEPEFELSKEEYERFEF